MSHEVSLIDGEAVCSCGYPCWKQRQATIEIENSRFRAAMNKLKGIKVPDFRQLQREQQEYVYNYLRSLRNVTGISQ